MRDVWKAALLGIAGWHLHQSNFALAISPSDLGVPAPPFGQSSECSAAYAADIPNCDQSDFSVQCSSSCASSLSTALGKLGRVCADTSISSLLETFGAQSLCRNGIASTSTRESTTRGTTFTFRTPSPTSTGSGSFQKTQTSSHPTGKSMTNAPPPPPATSIPKPGSSSATDSTKPAESGSSNSNRTKVAVGVSFGLVALLFVIIGIVLYIRRRRRRHMAPHEIRVVDRSTADFRYAPSSPFLEQTEPIVPDFQPGTLPIEPDMIPTFTKATYQNHKPTRSLSRIYRAEKISGPLFDPPSPVHRTSSDGSRSSESAITIPKPSRTNSISRRPVGGPPTLRSSSVGTVPPNLGIVHESPIDIEKAEKL